MDRPTRPAMRYHGGKWRLAPWIISHFPAHRVYVEAYGGAGSVLMRKPRSYAEVYNDMNGEIVNVFRVLRNPSQARELERVIRLTPFAREEFEASYIRDGDPIEQARRTIYRTFAGFGSAAFNADHDTGFRSCTTRSGSTPADDWVDYPDHIGQFCKRLMGVVIEQRPAVDVMLHHDASMTLHYVDPPYVAETRKERQLRNYREFEMTDEDHRELAAVLRELQGMVVLSGYACPLYDELYAGWHRVDRETYADGAQPRTETLWLSPRAQEQALPLFAEVTQ